MSSINKKASKTPVHTHEGAKTVNVTAKEQLKRTVMACMLWEDNFYESGVSVHDRIVALIPNIDAKSVYDIAVAARNESKLRHVPLLIARVMAKLDSHKHLVADLLAEIIQRPDELTEFIAIYWKDKKQPLSGQVKKGLARAFTKFNEYSLAKYNRDGAIKLRDVLFLCHAKPEDGIKGYTKSARKNGVKCPEDKGSQLFYKLVNDQLATPDTWEVELSAKGNNRESWERLLREKKLGALAILRNMRNMIRQAVSKDLIRNALAETNVDKVIPYRFIAAARYAPDYEPELEAAMFKSIADKTKIPGKTCIVVDVSGSMDSTISSKSDLKRLDAACGLAMLARELCDEIEIYSFSYSSIKVPVRRGFALRDAIDRSQSHDGTDLGKSMNEINSKTSYDRVIVITDEQSFSRPPSPKGKGYIINVAAYQNGIGYDNGWNHINGWSEAVLDYIRLSEENKD